MPAPWASEKFALSTFGLVELWVGLAAHLTIPLFEDCPCYSSGCCTVSAIHSMFSLASSFPVGAGNVFADGAAGIDFPSGAGSLPKSLSSGTGSQFLRRNTVGAIVGALLVGFILIPTIGVANSIVLPW